MAAYKGPGAITASTGHNYKDAAAYKYKKLTAPDGGCPYNTGWLQTKGLEQSRINKSRTLKVAATHL